MTSDIADVSSTITTLRQNSNKNKVIALKFNFDQLKGEKSKKMTA